MGHRLKTIWRHVMAWTAFILYEVSMTFVYKVRSPWYHYAIFYTLNIVLFYTSAHLLYRFDRKYRSRQIVTVGVIFIELVLYTMIMILVAGILEPGSELKAPWWYGVSKVLYRGGLFIGLSWGYFQHRKAIDQQAEKYALKLSQAEIAERNRELYITQLQAQLNPHLLYNAIQLLNAELKPEQARAKEIVKYLTQVFRYASTKTDENGEIPLADEFEQIEKFMALQQYLHAFTLKVELSIQKDDSIEGCRIAPLLLMTFVENVFKYGDIINDKTPATINISCYNRLLTLKTTNKKKNVVLNSTGIGLYNIKGLLETKYSDRNPKLIINDGDIYYVTSLSLTL